MDDESAPQWAADVADHLADCSDCRAWHGAAWQVTRSLRVRPVTQMPDLTAKILAAYSQ